MNKVYSRNFYTNPFRYGRFDTKIDPAEVLEEVEYDIEPFLNEKFPLIKDYIDELGNYKSEAKIIRFIKEQFNSLSKSFNFSLNNLETYNTNLRYLEFPVHPIVDKNGFEVQTLSSEFIDEAIDDIEDGFSYVYDYCSKTFPETIDLWYDYADFSQIKVPSIEHDIALDETYEAIEELLIEFYKSHHKEPKNLINLKNLVKRIIDRDFNINQEDLKNLIKQTITRDVNTEQEDSKNLIKWIITADLNKNLLKIFKPTIKQEITDCLIIILKSLFCLLIFLQITRTLLKSYFISNVKEKVKGEILEIYNNLFKTKEPQLKSKLKFKLITKGEDSMCFKRVGEKLTYIRRQTSNVNIWEPDVEETTWDYIKQQNQKIKSKLFIFRQKVKYQLLNFILRMQDI
uniref:Uncharacterized protein n=1 Tax=Eustigmatophyceae sp. Bat 8/9-7w TaxID=2506144 RepID=A0A451FLZ6_9STRA|nr:hypothetical protein [Eustigmatophyceae sp. Bat 8/9-7w]QAA11408.1 hypothetical protein [Eustigmatophyceae sp. Bat 8/9-7w]